MSEQLLYKHTEHTACSEVTHSPAADIVAFRIPPTVTMSRRLFLAGPLKACSCALVDNNGTRSESPAARCSFVTAVALCGITSCRVSGCIQEEREWCLSACCPPGSVDNRKEIGRGGAGARSSWLRVILSGNKFSPSR